MQRNSHIDFWRTIMAFLVICVHIPFPGELWNIFFPICRTAVPFFFMASGFFNEMNQNREGATKRQIKKMVLLVLYSNLFFFLYHSILTYLSGKNILLLMNEYFSLRNIASFFIFNSSQFEGSLWFLGTLLYCLIFTAFIRKCRGIKFVFIAIPILLGINMILGKYVFFLLGYEIPRTAIRNVIFVGIPYFYIGIFICKYQDQIRRFIAARFLIPLLLLFCIAMLLENQIHLHFNPKGASDFFLFLPLLTTTIFLTAFFYPDFSKNSWISKVGLQYSLMIYIIHPIFIDGFRSLNDHFHLAVVLNIFAPFFVFICSLIFAIYYQKIISSFRRFISQ